MIGIALLLAGVICIGVLLGPAQNGQDLHLAPATVPSSQPSNTLRIALIPERDIFAQRRRYKVLAEYLSQRLGRPVVLVSLNTYEAVLEDFAREEVDAAFLGSLIAVLVMDRNEAEVLVKPMLPRQVSTYRGVIFVHANSPIQTIEDLRGKSIAMLKGTTAADLFPISEFAGRGMLDGSDAPRMIWVGTHDEVVAEVKAGRADAGAVKDLVLEDWLAPGDWQVRRLAEGEPVPNNALVVRQDLDETLKRRLRELLLEMESGPEGRGALEAFGAVRFLPCDAREYEPVYRRLDQLGDAWPKLAIPGSAPKRRSASGPSAPTELPGPATPDHRE